LLFVSLAGFGALEGLGSGRHPAIRLTATLSVRLSHSSSPLSRQTYADNAGIALDRLILAGASFGLYLLGIVIPGPPDRAMHQVLVFAFFFWGARSH
jgi:hypothetical protein